MPSITMFDTRDPFDAGKATFAELLESGEVTADRYALIHALYEAAGHVAECWEAVSDEMSHAAASNDPVSARRAIELRENLTRATEIANGLLTALWESSPGIAEAEARDREAVAA
jgi:hypothetical protein